MRTRFLIVLLVAVAGGFLAGRALSPNRADSSAREAVRPGPAAPRDEGSSPPGGPGRADTVGSEGSAPALTTGRDAVPGGGSPRDENAGNDGGDGTAAGHNPGSGTTGEQGSSPARATGRDAVPGGGSPREESGGTPASSRPPAIPDDFSPEERRDIEVFRRASDSVVHITTSVLERDFFSLDVMQIPRGTGSGFVWDKDGHIVTNFHVIEGGDRFKVRLGDQSNYDAKVVGYAADKDLAVLQIRAGAGKLVPLEIGRSHDLLVGQRVLAVGNPFGLDHSLTVGVVSALGRELKSPNERTIHDVIQTDAAINPGNSGGPLLDSRGRLIGVNSAIYSPSGASAGVGFAVPVDTVRRLVPQLIENGHPIEPGIAGMTLLPDAYASRLDVEGVIVKDVARRSSADRAGLQGIRLDRYGDRIYLGDRIIAVDGKPIGSSDDLFHLFELAGVGKTVTLTVIREGRKRQVSIKLEPVG